ncbi:MAG: lysoplasmalogenase [Leptospiraceae bacterium]
MIRIIYFVALAFFSILYVVLSPASPFPGSMFLKTLPIWMVAAHVFLTLKDRKGRLLFLGVLLGSAGDMALATQYSQSFIIGLGFFLIGHIFYISSFAHQWEFQPWKIIPAAFVMALSIGLSIALTPHLNGLTIPVYAYVFVITLMVIFAIFRNPPSPAVWIGGVLFLLSDAIIAVKEFMKLDVPHESILIMASYYMAQILIGEGSIQDSRQEAKGR